VIITENYAAALFAEALQYDMVRQLLPQLHRAPWSSELKDDLIFQIDSLKRCIENLHAVYVSEMEAAGERLVGAL
jgi:hypothetical protein